MKHSTLLTAGMIAGLFFASSAAMAGPHGDTQKIQPQKYSVSKSVHKKAHKGYSQDIRGVNVAHFERMIANGAKQGRLTKSEVYTAKKGLNSLKATIRAVKSDRRVTNWEQNRVQQKAAQLSRQITRLLNNRAVVKSYKRGHNSSHHVTRR
ncbi:MAG: hypothetical protein R3F02_19820 [Thiolinea sp.]